MNDATDETRRMGAFAAALPALDGVDHLAYHVMAADKYRCLNRDYPLWGVRPASPERVDELAEVVGEFGLPVRIGG